MKAENSTVTFFTSGRRRGDVKTKRWLEDIGKRNHKIYGIPIIEVETPIGLRGTGDKSATMHEFIDAVNNRGTRKWRDTYGFTVGVVAKFIGIQQKLIRKLETRERLCRSDKEGIYGAILRKYWESDPGHKPTKNHRRIIIGNWMDFEGGL